MTDQTTNLRKRIEMGETYVIRSYSEDEDGNACLEAHFSTNDPQKAHDATHELPDEWEHIYWIRSVLTNRYQRVTQDLFLTELEWHGAGVDWNHFFGPDSRYSVEQQKVMEESMHL